MKRIYIKPVCKAATMCCDPLMIVSVYTGDSSSGGTGGGRQGSNNAFFDDEEEESVISKPKAYNVWGE